MGIRHEEFERFDVDKTYATAQWQHNEFAL
jgi:hypothetical protein